MARGKRIGATILVAIATVGLAMGIVATHQSTQASNHGALPTTAQAPLQVNMVIVPDAVLGSNKRTHDAFVPAVLTAKVGQKVIVTVYNLDTSPHSFTAQALGLNAIVAGAKSQGLEGITTFSFTASKRGTYHWKCLLPCDNGGVNAWAMNHDGYMAGTITIV
jgi:plastocyanin